ncbi:MAG: hypothetical protein N2645_20545 [Clostridia bacterium]|nr:hypothetical protein [Clostridia bacterium]
MAEADFFVNFFKAMVAIAGLGVVLAFVAVVISFVIEITNFREENSQLSTGVGNALLILHNFLEPGRKPQTEQVIVIKRKRTPIEKKVGGLTGVQYYNLYIKGYKRLEGKRYLPSKLKNK